MRTITTLVVTITLLAAGCASRPDIDPDSMKGRPLAEVIETYKLDEHFARPWINLPPDSPQVTTYYLEKGNLDLLFMGSPEVVMKAMYLPSDQSAAERVEASNAAYQKWLDSRSPKTTGTPSPRPSLPR